MDINYKLSLIDSMLSNKNSPLRDAAEKQAKQAEEFRQILEGLDAELETETEAERAKRKADEAEAAQEKQAAQRRISELYSLIAQLRQRVAAGGDKAAAAQLSMAQTELFWLQFGL